MKCFTIPDNELWCEHEAKFFVRTALDACNDNTVDYYCFSCFRKAHEMKDKSGNEVIELEMIG